MRRLVQLERERTMKTKGKTNKAPKNPGFRAMSKRNYDSMLNQWAEALELLSLDDLDIQLGKINKRLPPVIAEDIMDTLVLRVMGRKAPITSKVAKATAPDDEDVSGGAAR